MIPRFALTLLLLAAGSLTHSLAVDPSAEVAVAGFKLKNRSIYTLPESARPPFWPIGWQKKASHVTQVQEAPVNFTLDPEQFSVTSILLGKPSLAVINGKAYSEGEYIRVTKKAEKAPGTGDGKSSAPAGAKVRIAKITDGTVTMEVGGQSTQVTMRRPTVVMHHGEEEGADLLKPLSER